MTLKQKYGQTALVAGASEGLGAAFSAYLAAEEMDLVLIARRKEPLEKLAESLRAKYKIQVLVISCDLASADATQQIQNALNGLEINLFVYNAAIPHIGRFEENSLEKHRNMSFCNMITPMEMTQVLGTKMLEKGKGAIVLMSSLAGFQGSGFLAVYAATKAFNRVFAESLWYEWKEKGVDVIACCAGATATPNYLETKPEKLSFFAPKAQNPAEVVTECFVHLGKKASFVSGFGNKIASFLMQKLMSSKMAINVMGDNTRKMYRL